jgi:hypothetical protein
MSRGATLRCLGDVNNAEETSGDRLYRVSQAYTIVRARLQQGKRTRVPHGMQEAAMQPIAASDRRQEKVLLNREIKKQEAFYALRG